MIQPRRKRRERKERSFTDQEQKAFKHYEDWFQKWILSQVIRTRTSSEYGYYPPFNVFVSYISEIHDWYTQTRNNSNEIFSFTWEQAKRESDAWHAAAAGEGEGKVYEPTNPELIVYSPPAWKGWSIQKVVSENDMLTEGNLMSHCVGQYCDQVGSGQLEVFSLRDPKNKPHVTIGIDKEDRIIQLQGNSNSEPDEEYKSYLRQWFPILQKERPQLEIVDEDMFNFYDLRYGDSNKIDEEIHDMVYKANDYGIEGNLANLDIEYAYAAVIQALSAGGFQVHDDVRNVHHIGLVIAQVAWDADKARAKIHGLFDRPYTEKSPDYKRYKRESLNKGVDWLQTKIDMDNDDFYQRLKNLYSHI